MNIWSVIYRSTWIVLGVMAIAGGTGMMLPRWHEYRSAMVQKAEAEDKVRLEEEMLRILKEKQERLERDPRFVQQLAHDMGMARPGEILFKFRESESPTARPK